MTAYRTPLPTIFGIGSLIGIALASDHLSVKILALSGALVVALAALAMERNSDSSVPSS